MTELDWRPLRGEVEKYAISINVDGRHHGWQLSSVALISSSLSQVFSEVEHLTLGYAVYRQSSEEHNEVDHTEWRKLLGPFINVKTIRIDDRLVGELSLAVLNWTTENKTRVVP